MPQSPTKQELGKRAVEIFQKAKEILPGFDWQWRLQDKYQEWRAVTKDPTLLDFVTLYNAFVEYLEGWTIDWVSYEEIHFGGRPLQKWKKARELKLSIVFNSEVLEIQVGSDVGMSTPYDDVDPNDESGWKTPDWYKPGNSSYEYWQKQLEEWHAIRA